MKYKNLGSFAHNFSHSFMSGANYAVVGHVPDDLRALARRNPGAPLVIRWLPPGTDLPAWRTERIDLAIASYRDWLPRHAANHRIDLGRVLELRTEIACVASRQIVCESVLIDDRGREYRQRIAC